MRKIVVITTGGTIGSILEGTSISVNQESDKRLRDEIELICRRRKLNVEVRPIINKNSENMNVSDWMHIAEEVENLVLDGVDGIVITHGTDTLHFTASVIGLLFDRSTARICFTGSFLPLSNPNSDAYMNLVAAIKAVVDDDMPYGVFVAFRNGPTKVCNIFHCFDVKPMYFDDPAFSVLYSNYSNRSYKGLVEADRTIAKVITDRSISVDYSKEFFNERRKMYPYLRFSKQKTVDAADVRGKIFYINAYPGLDMRRIDRNGLECLIVGLYHSGTASSESYIGSLVSFIRDFKQNGLVLCASLSSVYDNHYENMIDLAKEGARIYYDLQPHILFCFATLCLRMGKSQNEITDALSLWELEKQD